MTTKEIITQVLTELGPVSVDRIRNHDLCRKAKIWSNNTLSRHLNSMLMDGLVSVEKRGSTKIWTLKPRP